MFEGGSLGFARNKWTSYLFISFIFLSSYLLISLSPYLLISLYPYLLISLSPYLIISLSPSLLLLGRQRGRWRNMFDGSSLGFARNKWAWGGLADSQIRAS